MSGQQISNESLHESLPQPIPYTFLSSVGDSVVMLYSNCKFYRTAFNNSVSVLLSVGNNFTPTNWFSQDGFLPNNVFNSTKPITEVSFPNNNCVQINANMKFFHQIEIDYKLVKNLSMDSFQNFRKIQVMPCRADGITPIDTSFVAYRQPGPNNRDIMLCSFEINHQIGDIIKLRFNVVQDNSFSDVSDTYLIIYGVTWNLSGLKVI